MQWFYIEATTIVKERIIVLQLYSVSASKVWMEIWLPIRQLTIFVAYTRISFTVVVIAKHLLNFLLLKNCMKSAIISRMKAGQPTQKSVGTTKPVAVNYYNYNTPG